MLKNILMSLNFKANHQTFTCRDAEQFFLTAKVPFAAATSPELIISNKLCTRERLHEGYIPGVYSVITNNLLKKQALCVCVELNKNDYFQQFSPRYKQRRL